MSYGAVQALTNVSFTAAESEVTAVLGANGAGKTTLLRAITGLVRPRSGTIRYDGEQLEKMSVESIVRHGVAHVPEGRSVIDEMTVDENLRLGSLWRFGRRERGAVIDEVYELFPPLAERRRQHASTLSGGERQMLAIGRALVSRPNVLLLDEPSLGLAPIVTARLMAVLRDLTMASNLIVVLVEQNARSALSIAERAVVINLGRVVVFDDAGERCRRHRAPPPLSRVSRRAPATMQFFVNITLGGIASGMIVAAVALGLVLIFRATNIVNFAQGAMAMMTTYIAYAICTKGSAIGSRFVAPWASACCSAHVVQFVLIRPVQNKSPLNAVIVTFGFLIFLEGIAGAIWGEHDPDLPGAVLRGGPRARAPPRSRSRPSTCTSVVVGARCSWA